MTTDRGGDFGWQRTVVSSLDEQSFTGISTGRQSGEMSGTWWGIPTSYFRGVFGGKSCCFKMDAEYRGCIKSFQRNVLHECWVETFVRIVWEVMQHFFFWVESLLILLRIKPNSLMFLHGFMYTGNIRALFQCPTNHGDANDACQRLSTMQSTKD